MQGKPTLLLADDEKLYLSSVANVLSSDYEVRTVANGGELFRALEESSYDVLLLDYYFGDVVASEATDTDVSYEIKRWRSDNWELLEKDKQVELALSPVGLVEPISIRCSLGRSWIKHELHPLTAGMRDEELYIVKE